MQLNAPADQINVHVGGGNILVMQGEAMTTQAARGTPFHLVVVMSESGNSSGGVFLDDGDDLDFAVDGGRWSYVSFDSGFVGNDQVVVLESRVLNGEFALSQNWTIGSATILGLKKKDITKGCDEVAADNNGFVTLELSN